MSKVNFMSSSQARNMSEVGGPAENKKILNLASRYLSAYKKHADSLIRKAAGTGEHKAFLVCSVYHMPCFSFGASESEQREAFHQAKGQLELMLNGQGFHTWAGTEGNTGYGPDGLTISW
jgi:hypothetical protein